MMKTCPGCGNPVPEEATFCPHCGKPLETQADGPHYQSAPAGPPPAAGGEPPAIQTVRQLFGSPLHLAVAIAYTVTVVSNLLSLLISTTGVMTGNLTWMTDLTGTAGWNGEMSSVMNTALWSSLLWSFISQIPAILNLVALWMLYTTARDRSGAPFKTAGLTILRTLQIIILVLVGLLLVVMLGLVVVALAVAGLGENGEVFAPLMGAMLVILVIIAALAMLYGVQFIRSMDSIRKTVWTGTVQGSISLFVAVFTILGGILMLFYLPLGLLSGAPLTALAGLSSAVAYICSGILLFRSRDEWQRLKDEQARADGTAR